MRRYKYLEKMFEEEMKKVLVFMKGFSPKERIKLARMTALWISNGSVPPTILSVLINEHLVKDNLALDFLLEVFVTWKQEKGLSSLMTALKKGGIEGRYGRKTFSLITYICIYFSAHGTNNHVLHEICIIFLTCTMRYYIFMNGLFI